MNREVFLLAGCLLAAAPVAVMAQTNVIPPPLLAFSTAKQHEAQELAQAMKIPLPPEAASLFGAAVQGDAATVTNALAQLVPAYQASYADTNQPAWVAFWQPMTEVESAYELFGQGGAKYAVAFGNGIIESVPAGSIYFGGTDQGRMLVTALCKSQARGEPFFTLTQNALSDSRYEDYLHSIYGGKIRLPGTNEVQAAVDDYKADALRRLRHDRAFPAERRQLRPGEMVREVAGDVEITGPVSVMAINGQLLKLILDDNPQVDFYYEESFPLRSIYPYLSPHGLVFQVHHQPLADLASPNLDEDHAFWTRQCAAVLGDWLKPETSVSNVCAFAKATHVGKRGAQYSVDREFIDHPAAGEWYSKLRVSIAGLYEWRIQHTTGTVNQVRLQAEADYAYRQAYALSPTSSEALFRYVNFLMSQKRLDDAILLAHTTEYLVPYNEDFQSLSRQLENSREQTREMGNP